ncbi:MAG: VCBS repeat-containing protein [Saprospiraceae bacterium]|nr:VCBS repeat-containing protein [Saprospiraceae bacterium]
MRKFCLRIVLLSAVVLYACSPIEREGALRFAMVDAQHSGVDFVNAVSITDSLNILTSEFVYNGGGVAVADVNGDNLPDLFFSGNQVDNRLYLNRGGLAFEDITEVAKVTKPAPQFWSSGASIVDLNGDGLLDIYVCNTFVEDAHYRGNFLYINQGNDGAGIPSFLEMGKAYGLADTSHSSHAQFLDYDRDGDLDVFIGVNLIEEQYPNQFIPLNMDGNSANRDILLRCDYRDDLDHPHFVDVSVQSGIVQDGYSHSSLVFDVNEDGWPDIYVANDYFSNDLFFINNQDGTFTNRSKELMKHGSLSAMGSDAADVNGDGRLDFFTSEMQPYYNKRKKLFQGASNYQNTINTIRYNYDFQYTRNTLQLNRGPVGQGGLPIFSEVGLFAGVMETDWSWSALFADFDYDGHQDLFVANGFPKDVTDRDFADFRAMASRLVSLEKLYKAIPEVKSPNFLFRNNGDLTFENSTKQAGMLMPSFSYGAAYADLDLDGDLDLVTNNLFDPAFVFENRLWDKEDEKGAHLRVELIGPQKNRQALGSSVFVFAGQKKFRSDVIAGRGYLSQSELIRHFGIDHQIVDSIRVGWPNGKLSTIREIDNQHILIEYGTTPRTSQQLGPPQKALLYPVGDSLGLTHTDEDIDFIDFNFQRTLPHKFSQYGPALAVGDVNGDGTDDLLVGGSRHHQMRLFTQTNDGFFESQEFSLGQGEKREEETGILLFDADGDGHLDLYLGRGSGQYPPSDSAYRDVIGINDGSGNFVTDASALPAMFSNTSCVKASDIDGDGDLDLFVGSRVLPHHYPKSDRNYILINESQDGNVAFRDETEKWSSVLADAGMISDALWTDFDGDRRPDLVLAGEWMPVRFFANKGDHLEEITERTGIDGSKGWWNSIAGRDLDRDGDVDYVLGNFGRNIYFQCSGDEPLRLYAHDWDDNGSIDPLISCYWPDSMGVRKEFFYHPRQDMLKQFSGLQKKFQTYGEFGEATVEEVFSADELKDAVVLEATTMSTVIVENLGGGRFTQHDLPMEAQFGPVYGSLIDDVDGDGHLDILLIGNDHGMEVQQGRADALNGVYLRGHGGLMFDAQDIAATGFFVPGDARALVNINVRGQLLVVASQNKGATMTFAPRIKMENSVRAISPRVSHATITYPDGSEEYREFYHGSGFFSQSSRSFQMPADALRIDLFATDGTLVNTIRQLDQ